MQNIATRVCEALARQGDTPTIIETHISWVVLSHSFAYKIKKPVKFDFIDASTPDRRKLLCLDELRLNRRLAPELYLGLVPICNSPEGLILGGDGVVVEYATQMHRLPQGSLASDHLAAGTLTRGHLIELGELLCRFHESAPVAYEADGLGTPAVIVNQTARALENLKPWPAEWDGAAIQQWLHSQSVRLAPVWQRRLVLGHVREGHGDLHLANVLFLGAGRITAFDCVEFDPALRWIDVMSDVAFLVMDLWAHEHQDLGFAFLNAYLECSADHDGLGVLRYYLVYRALVRALVTKLRHEQGLDVGPLQTMQYLHLATHLMQCSDPRLLITHGLPGSGKSHVTQSLMEQVGAIRVRSDIERRRATQAQDLYGAEAHRDIYGRLADVARVALQAGFPTIIDATFLHGENRKHFKRLAHALGVPFSVLNCHGPLVLLMQRVRERAEQGQDASKADELVLLQLAQNLKPLSGGELTECIDVPAQAPPSIAKIAARWLAKKC